jgi:hypothetical protein
MDSLPHIRFSAICLFFSCSDLDIMENLLSFSALFFCLFEIGSVPCYAAFSIEGTGRDEI